MIIERFKNGKVSLVYKRFNEKGRLAPDGLKYISSWVDEEMKTCFQLMETDNKKLLEEWIANWKDLVDFEVFLVMSSEEATKRINSKK